MDPFEPDGALPFLGAGMNGGRPDFTTPSNNLIGRVEGWRIDQRSLNGGQDLDWMIFYRDEYPYCPQVGEIQVLAVDSFSRANLRVEVLGYPRTTVLNPSVTPLVLQSCSQAPVGSSSIDLGKDDFRDFYRIRSCSNAGPVNYRFEFRIIEPAFCFALSSVEGVVRDVRNNRASKGAYVYTDQNSVTFSSPDNGKFALTVFQRSDVILDFFAGDLESLGAVNIGPVAESDFITGVTLLGQPAGMIFYAGFE